MSASVVGIGASVYDILMTVEGYPHKDTKQRGLETRFQCGGPCATGLVAVRKLGETACYMGTVGDDLYGAFVKAELERYGVDTARVRVKPGLTFHSVVLPNTRSGSRTCVWNRGDAAPPTEDDVDLDVLRQAKFLHLDGNHLDCAIYAAKKAREFGVTVSMDAARALQQTCHPQTLIVTQGSRGGFLWEDGREVRYPVFPVHTIDSNGAGDTFHGAFLAARLKGMSVYEACRFASAASALKCTRFGAQQGIPSCGEVLDFLKAHDGVIVEA